MHRLTEVQVRTRTLGEREVRGHRRLRPDETGLGLVQPDLVRARRERGEPAPHLCGVEQLVRQVPLPCREQAARDGERVLPTEEQATVQRHDVLTGVALQLLPQLVGAQQQRHVRRVLEVGLPGDPRPAVT